MESQRRKKILFIITKSNWGGAQKYVFDLATSLPRERFDAAVALGGNGVLKERLTEADIRTITIGTLQRDVSFAKEIRSLFDLYSIFKNEKPDIVHVNSSKAGGLGAAAARIAGVPRIVFTCHGWPFNESRGNFSRAIIWFFSWLTVMFSHVTIAVSSRDAESGRKMPWARRKVALVYNGIREPAFKSRDEARSVIISLSGEKGVEIGPDDFLVGAIGELHKNKGYAYMLKAFTIFKNDAPRAKLAIISEGEERAALESLSRELGVEKNVSFIGFLKDAPTYLKAFDAFILSSIKEGLPYVVIEAGFAGLPVVATDVGGVKEIIDDMISGILVQTRKPKELAQGLRVLVTEKEKAASFGAALYRKVRSEFSLEKMVRETVSVYEGISK